MSLAPLPGARAEILTFPGTCDASAAVAIDDQMIIVGDDESQKLFVYDLRTQTLRDKIPLPYDFADRRTGGKGEADIEGATILKGRVVWISSHSRNSEGEADMLRSRLFISHNIDQGQASVAFSANFGGLLFKILNTQDGSYAPLRAAIGDLSLTNPDLAPKKRGLNLEGVTAAPDGDLLLIGVRNPQHNGAALLFELAGFDAFMRADPSKLALGEMHELNLGGRGIRDIAWSEAHQSYVIVAGQIVDRVPGPGFALYKWDGAGAPVQIGDFKDLDPDFQPEAVVPLLDKSDDGLVPSKSILILSDEGTVELGDGRKCKKADEKLRRFRGIIRHLD